MISFQYVLSGQSTQTSSSCNHVSSLRPDENSKENRIQQSLSFPVCHIFICFYKNNRLVMNCMSSKTHSLSFFACLHRICFSTRSPFVQLCWRRQSINFDLTSAPAQQVFWKQRDTINPTRSMFTGKQNVISPTIYQVFDRKQKPAGISFTSVSCDASGQKSWNHSLREEKGGGGRVRGRSSRWFWLRGYR